MSERPSQAEIEEATATHYENVFIQSALKAGAQEVTTVRGDYQLRFTPNTLKDFVDVQLAEANKKMAEQQAIIQPLIAIARAAHFAADDTCDTFVGGERCLVVAQVSYDDLCRTLEIAEDLLPHEGDGVVFGTSAAQAEYAVEKSGCSSALDTLLAKAKEEGRAEAQASIDSLEKMLRMSKESEECHAFNARVANKAYVEHDAKLVEAQAHIKVLEASGAELAALLAEIFNPMPLEWKEKVDASIASRVSEAMFCQGYALVFSKWYKQNELRTSPTEALDKVVREAVEDMREKCAYEVETMSQNCTRYEYAEAIRRIEP